MKVADYPAFLVLRRYLKAISKNEYTRIAQDFCSFSRRKKGAQANYATVFTTQKMDKKTSKSGIFFVGNRLDAIKPQLINTELFPIDPEVTDEIMKVFLINL